MYKFISFFKEFRFPSKKELLAAYKSFSQKEFYVFSAAIVLAFISMVLILGKINNYFIVDVPTSGGSITEGIIGVPTLVNPVLAVSDADKNLTSMVYSGLMRKTPEGDFIPDLAETYSVSPNELEYTFTIREDAKFHDKVKVTADDIIFTIEKIKDPLLKSPRKSDWDNVTVEKIDDRTVVFKLSKTYLSFMDDATIGILPLHIWKNISTPEFSLSYLNIKATGSGPYKIDKVTKNSDGVPEQYSLSRFNSFTLGKPHIKRVNIVSFANEKDMVKALLSHSINQASGISSENALKLENNKYTINVTTLPRVFGLFFNNNKIFTYPEVKNVLNKVIDKEEIVTKVLNGYGTVINNPIPETIFKEKPIESIEKVTEINEAISILEKNGWSIGEDGIRQKGGTTTTTKTTKVNGKSVTKTIKTESPIIKLAFSITTGDTPELKQAAQITKEQLEKVGIAVEVKIYETGQLNRLIKERDYEALFFGEVINNGYDLYSFWHSSKKNYPGNNIAMYSNKKIDIILDEIRKTTNEDILNQKYTEFVTEINKDLPAIFIYSPKNIYATSKNLNHNINTINTPSDHFLSIYTWYAKVDHVWKIFTK